MELENFAKGKIMVDLGAWQGDITPTLSKMAGEDGLVISIEPEIENFKKLVKTTIELKLSNVIPLCVAIANYTGFGDIFLSKYGRSHSICEKAKFCDLNNTQNILTVSWDWLMRKFKIDKVDFVKVDIEGAEEDLLMGMNTVFPERMMIEEHTRSGITDLKNLEKLIEEKGYKIVERSGKHNEYLFIEKYGG